MIIVAKNKGRRITEEQAPEFQVVINIGHAKLNSEGLLSGQLLVSRR